MSGSWPENCNQAVQTALCVVTRCDQLSIRQESVRTVYTFTPVKHKLTNKYLSRSERFDKMKDSAVKNLLCWCMTSD